MAILTNAKATYNTDGKFVEFDENIYNVDPTDTPVLAAIDEIAIETTTYFWQTDTLEAPSTTAALEGDAFTAQVLSATTEVNNVAQITRRDFTITGTNEAVRKYGRDSEITYQTMKKNKEIRNSQEKIIFNNQGLVVGSTSVARQLRALPSWVKTNVALGDGGANAVTVSARVDGSATAYTETKLLTVHEAVWQAGGNPTLHVSNSKQKRVLSTFDGSGQTRFDKSEDKKIFNTVEVYESDFGVLTAVMSRHVRAREVFLLDVDMLCVGYLRPTQTVEIGKQGDGDGFMVLNEWTLKVGNEKACGAVYDLT